MDNDNIYISISTLFHQHRTYFLHTTSILFLTLLLPKILNLPHFYRTTIFLCISTFILFSAVKRYSSNLPPEEEDTTSPTFERVQAAGKAKPTSAVVWAKSQVWKRDAQGGQRKGGGKRERGEEMGW
ncbi:uncharacterized protein J4E79_007152 [Alternaria viburni]|uniref:uncharacterized protein n=1 Tax=Alternaria viburni TaxID=566460 RepID=UPI0020C471FF|nr:uncharacterized protein J4E79_007152 [Alternaria viburni]KAI4658170.1 hypothetical protein J4E79_007152 [Alternaria viburni]